MTSGTILLVDDNKSVLTSLELLLECEFSEIKTASNPNQIESILLENAVDVVLLDMNFKTGVNNGNEGIFWLKRIKSKNPALPVIMLTAYGDVELAVKAVKSGASDFLLKPWDNDKIIEVVRSTLKESTVPVTKGSAKSEPSMLFGTSPAMGKLLKIITRAAKTDANILITGENGTGKEVLAKEIHRLSLRNRFPMMSVDMGAVSETLFESELFGHEKGAFTDARESRTGKFEAADKSTLFLDEIGNLSLALQAKLLAVLQSREITRLGSNRKIPVDIRLISATNKDIETMVRNESFREDLLYRINTIHLEIPPLRERAEDIPSLIEFFLRKYAALYNRPKLKIQEQATLKLQAYDWPGNIRELQHTIEKAVILCEDDEIKAKNIFIKQNKQKPFVENPNLTEIEKQVIELTIAKNNGNLRASAEQLGISRQTLYNKIRRFKL